MNSTSATPAPFWSKIHSSQHATTAWPNLPPRPATSPTLRTPPVPPKDAKGSKELRAPSPPPKATAAEHRWSEVVPPATALTFAAIWDPEDGLVTFSGASLSASVNGGNSASPEDADACSQVLTVDFLNLGTAPNTAKDSLLYPYSQSRFAASEISTQRFPVSPTRRSSVGTGLALDTSICPELEKQMKRERERGRGAGACRLAVSSPKSGRLLPPRGMHHHSSSQDSGNSHSLSAFGSSICNAFRRVASPKQGPSRAERYAFLRRTSGKVGDYDDHDEKVHVRIGDSGSNTPLKSPGFRSIFARSIWNRGGIAAGRDEGLVCRPQLEDDCDGITLDSGFDCLDIDSAYETWPGEHGGGRAEFDNALQRDVNKLKSTFSWTTTSTSRYIDVAAYFENDSDTDSTVSSLGAPIASTASPFHSQQANSISVHAQEGDCDSPWLPVEPPTPQPGPPVPQHPKPQQRNVLRKSSKTQIACPPPVKAPCKSSACTAGHDRQHYQICPQCDLRIEHVDLEVKDCSDNSKKGKGRANSQPDPPDSLRNTVSFGRPATARSSSSPASLAFPHHSRSQSLPGSRAATPAEVLARASYNHEWASPIPSRPISHVRSPSAPQPGSPATTTMSSYRQSARSTTPTRTCQHFADVRDVLRGVRSGIRPSTPIPGMPPVPPKNRPPPTSFRPVSAGGRERGRSGTPVSNSTHSHARASHLTRSQSHITSTQTPSSMRSRTRSLESLRGTAHALASASTAPLRTLWRARSFIRNSHSDQPKRSDPNDEDGIWVCVDIKTPANKANVTTSPEGQSPVGGQ